MPKGRHLKPDFFTDKHIVAMTPLARLLYQGLWCYAADCGHLDDEPVELKMRILPADSCDVDTLLDEIADQSRIERKDGVIFVPKLRDHARVDRRYETTCDACKEDAGHAVATTGTGSPKGSNPAGARRGHDGTTRGPQRDHDADGDGDGDGDGDMRAKPRGASRASKLPSDWQPSQAHQRLAAERGVDVMEEAAKFRDWCAGNGSTKKDWEATFRNWIRNARPTGNVRHLRTETDDQGRTVLPPLPPRSPWGQA